MNPKKLCELYAQGQRHFPRINLNEANLRNVNLSGANFAQAQLNVTNLSGANLSQTNLQGAKLNVARLSAANLRQANLNYASLNVANLIRADLAQAQLVEALMIRAELVRATLNTANLSGANLEGTDLREATLRQANLSYCNLTDSNLRSAFLTEAILEQAILSGVDLTRADLQAVNLREADLAQAQLTCANLRGADLRGANLRWTDLSGADLRWADLSEAKLSGANLTGADLSEANLVNASLVHADLSRAYLIKAEWSGADLTGAILTGAKLYGVSRARLIIEGLICDWVDLSPQGNETQIHSLTTTKVQTFFHETPPAVEVTVDAPFTLDANLALASIYHQVTRIYPQVTKPPNIRVSLRRTYLKFYVESNEDLFITAFYATLPFQDAEAVKRHLVAFLHFLQAQDTQLFNTKTLQYLHQVNLDLKVAIEHLQTLIKNKTSLCPPQALPKAIEFLNAPTYTAIANSQNKILDVYHHPDFGKRLLDPSMMLDPTLNDPFHQLILPPPHILIQFVQDFF